MNYPGAEAYVRAVQEPGRCFLDEDFARARFATHPIFQIPMPVAGSAAVVFRATLRGTDRALRFLTRPVGMDRARAEALDAHIVTHGLDGDVVRVRWVDDAIEVNGLTWPVMDMEWVEGSTLDVHVERLVAAGDRSTISGLADRWRRLVARLQRAGFAHGDLAHGNVLVHERGALRLVDLDGAWTERLAGSPESLEAGHLNYQPWPTGWHRWMDTGPALVIYLSLRALALEPGLWSEFHDGENLIFQRADLTAVHRTPVWSALERLHDPELMRLDSAYTGWLRNAGRREVSLEALLSGRPDEVAGAPGGEDRHVFVSYAREDQAVVRELAGFLREAGHSVWLDTTGTVAGRDWTDQIVAAIRRSTALVLVVSRHSMASKAVRREVQFADENDLAIIPVVIDAGVDLPPWYRFAFAFIHRIDAAGDAVMRRAAADVAAALGDA